MIVVVIIMAAGRGSRMGLKEGMSKCSICLDDFTKVGSVSNLINQFLRLGIDKNFTVVVGYASTHLVNSINRSKDKGVNVTYVYNNFWEDYGSGYSLSTAWSTIQDDEPLYIVEGDSVFSDHNLNLISSYSVSLCLVRGKDYLSSKSVAVLSHGIKVMAFLYDSTHMTDFSTFTQTNLDTYDSMQLWKINRDDVKQFKRILKDINQDYLNYGSSGFKDQTNLTPLNRMISHGLSISYIETDDPDGWVNLNTKKDIEKAKNLINHARGVQSTNE